MRFFRQLLILPLLTFSIFCHSQLQKSIDYSSVDSFSRTVRYDNDIYKLTKELTSPYTEQVLKVRAIFIWITDNIRYDYKLFNRGGVKGPECKTGQNCERIFSEWETAYIKNVLKKKKGVCDGYARAFKKMCDIIGVPCEIIDGYTKTKPYHIGITGTVDHAWNAVWLDSTYYLVDATWAAGYSEENEESGKLTGFTKHFNEYYWFPSFHDLARNHYPKNGKWVFDPNYTKEKFAANPYYSSNVISKINLLSPKSGIIQAKQGDTIHFQFEYIDDIHLLQLNTNIFRNLDVITWKKISRKRKVPEIDTLALKKQKYINFGRKGNHYEFDYIVPDNSLYYMELLFDYRRALRFKVKTEK